MTPEAIEIFRRMMDDARGQVRVAAFGRITAVTSTGQTPTVDVELTVKDAVETSEGESISEDAPPLRDVPVMFPQCGPFSITWPLMVGGTVLLVFCGRDFASWFSSGGISNEPLDERTHSMDYAVAFPVGFSTGNGPSTAPAGMVFNASEILMGGPGAAFHMAIAEKVATELSAIRTTFNAHTHVVPMGTSNAPLPVLGPPGDVSSTLVKVVT